LTGGSPSEKSAIHFEDEPIIQLSPNFTIEEMRAIAEAYGMPFRRSARYDVVIRLDSEKKESIRIVRERIYKVQNIEP
jgi:hypothetical protein